MISDTTTFEFAQTGHAIRGFGWCRQKTSTPTLVITSFLFLNETVVQR